jgi:lysozyme
MKPSKNCIDLIKEFEGFSDRPYLCPAKKWTIGYGNTFYPNGLAVKQTDPQITRDRAIQLLTVMVDRFAEQVHKLIKVPITQNQFDALVSLAYNIGIGNFRNSTLLRKLNLKENNAVLTAQINRWNRANGQIMAGLTRRRKAEAQLFNKL